MNNPERRELLKYMCWLQEDLDHVEKGTFDALGTRGKITLLQSHLHLINQIQHALIPRTPAAQAGRSLNGEAFSQEIM